MPEDYLFDEVRCGYYIPAMMKKAWACSLKVLSEVDRICKKYGIRYFADWGTVLGAVRHAGFIPWDDDLDISMFRKDYRRFCEVAAIELPRGYIVENIHTNPDYDLFLARVTSSAGISFDEEFLEENHGFPYRTGLDIFVMDHVEADEEKRKALSEKCIRLIACGDRLYQSIDLKRKNGKDGERIIPESHDLNVIREAEKLGDFKMDISTPLRQQIYIRVEEFFASVDEDTTDLVAQMFPWGLKEERLQEKKYYEDLVRLPFEYTEIPVPAAYDHMLKTRYGDFMKYNRNYGAHDYPFYEAQKKLFEKKTGVKVPEFFDPLMEFDESMLIERKKELKRNGERLVVFIPYRDKYWDALKPYYEKCISEPGTVAVVIPVPVYLKGTGYEIKKEYYELDGFPEDLELYDYTQIDLKELHPDVIYIQDPYDAFHASATIHPDYYVGELKECTDRLIYVPYFDIKDFPRALSSNEFFCMRHYCNVPGVVYADEIILPTEDLKNRYIEKLSEFSGGRHMPCMDSLRVEQRPKVMTEGKDVKKKLLFVNTISSLYEHRSEFIRKLKDVLGIFYDIREKIELIWSPQQLLDECPVWLDEEIWDEYRKLVSDYKDAGWGKYVKESELTAVMDDVDAYYGDPGAFALECSERGRPVMIMNVF